MKFSMLYIYLQFIHFLKTIVWYPTVGVSHNLSSHRIFGLIPFPVVVSIIVVSIIIAVEAQSHSVA